MPRSLRGEFDAVRLCYFSRWTAGRSWKVRRGVRSPWRHPWTYAEPQARVLWVGPWLVLGSIELTASLIHECCHVVTNRGHGAKWSARMRRAAERARSLGRLRLASELEEHVHAAERAPTRDPDEVYAFIEDRVREGLSFVESARRLCAAMNIEPAGLMAFPDLRAVYDQREQRRRELATFDDKSRTTTIMLDTNAASYLFGRAGFSADELARVRGELGRLVRDGAACVRLTLPLLTELAGIATSQPVLYEKIIRFLATLSDG